jgi:ribonuclease P protein component
MKLSFPKSEKLKSRTIIKQLFDEGKSFSAFPLKLIYIQQNNSQITRATFAVPKRNFKSAVNRNRIKRQMREAYRLHKQLLTTNKDSNYALLFIYLSKDKPKYAKLEATLKVLLKKLADENN